VHGRLGLQTTAKPGANGSNKADIPKAQFATGRTASVLGTFGFDRNGNTTLKSCGVHKIAASGGPAFFETVTPARVVG
jgi:hypothetical protein